MRRTCSATASDPHATTSAARSGARSPVRSSHCPQPGRRTPHWRACHTSGAGTNTTDGTPSARARRGPAVWNSSCRCHTHATSWPLPRTAGIDAEPARPLPLARVLRRGLHDAPGCGGATAGPTPRRSASVEARRRSSSATIDTFGRDDPHVAEQPPQRARPPRRAHPRRDRSLLARGDRRQHEDRAVRVGLGRIRARFPSFGSR